MESHVFFKGEKLFNVLKCDLITMNNNVGYVYFTDFPNSSYLKGIIGNSGPLVFEEDFEGRLVWKYSREVLFYPFEESYWDKDLGIICRVSYRLVKDNKIDNLANMIGDMKKTNSAYRDELRAIHASGLLVTRLEEFLDRLDQDEEKLKDFENLHLTTRKRLISDYSINYVDTRGKFE